MKRLFFSLCAVGLSCAAFGAGPEVNIVPKPLSVTPGAGTFTVTASTVIGVDKNAELRRSARIFAGEVAPVVGGVMKTAAEGDVPSGGGRLAGGRGLYARRDSFGRRGARRNAAGRLPRPAKPAPAGHRRRRRRARRDGQRQTLFRPPRGHARSLPSFLDGGRGQGVYRHPRHTQAQQVPLAPDRRSGLAYRDQKIPRADARGIGARGDAHRPPSHLERV